MRHATVEFFCICVVSLCVSYCPIPAHRDMYRSSLWRANGSPTSVQSAPLYQPAEELLHRVPVQWLSCAISVNHPVTISPVCPIVLQWKLLVLLAVQKQTISLFALQMSFSGSAPPCTILGAYSLRHPRGSAVMQALASLFRL